MVTAVGGNSNSNGNGNGALSLTSLHDAQYEVKPNLRKGMYLAFIDDAFAQRKKVSKSPHDSSAGGRESSSLASFFTFLVLPVSQGINDRYFELLSQFRSFLPSSTTASSSAQPTASTSTSPPTPTQLRIWLDALTHVVSKLDESHTPLVEMILAIPWATMDDHFVSAYVRFIGALVSARMEWLRSVLEKCVKGFKYRELLNFASPRSWS